MQNKDIKKQSIYHTSSTLVILAFIGNLFLPATLFAQSYPSSEGQGSWQDADGWRRRSNPFDIKVNNLGTNKVVDVPVPILFGITPENLTRNFGDPRGDGRIHEGLDIMAPQDAPIVTPTDAVVIRVGTGASAGNYVYTANPGGETFAYLHLSSFAPNIQEGDEIKKGALIGYVGDTGNAVGGAPHLHFEIRDNNGFIDPFTRLARIFPLADKIQYMNNILNNAGSVKSTIENNIITLYRKELILAQTLNIALPASITEALKIKTITEISTMARTLKLGSVGNDVKLLQTILGISADGSFGPKTKAAVGAFQLSKNLTPDGVFGPKSRAVLMGSSGGLPLGCTSTAGYSTLTGIKCTTIL